MSAGTRETQFRFLLIPALAVQQFAANMRVFALYSSLLGGCASFLGFYLACRWDWPVGPTDVVLLGAIYGMTWALLRLRLLWKRATQDQTSGA